MVRAAYLCFKQPRSLWAGRSAFEEFSSGHLRCQGGSGSTYLQASLDNLKFNVNLKARCPRLGVESISTLYSGYSAQVAWLMSHPSSFFTKQTSRAPDTEAGWGRVLAGKFSALNDLGTGMKNHAALLWERLEFTVLLSLLLTCSGHFDC